MLSTPTKTQAAQGTSPVSTHYSMRLVMMSRAPVAREVALLRAVVAISAYPLRCLPGWLPTAMLLRSHRMRSANSTQPSDDGGMDFDSNLFFMELRQGSTFVLWVALSPLAVNISIGRRFGECCIHHDITRISREYGSSNKQMLWRFLLFMSGLEQTRPKAFRGTASKWMCIYIPLFS